MALLVAACVAAGLGWCPLEDAGVVEDLGRALREGPRGPVWATAGWRVYAAHIVASEARGVPSADLVVACTMVRDVQRGWDPWALYPGRWHGWGLPDDGDRAAVARAVAGGCAEVPDYVYVGNQDDAWYWYRVGLLDGPVHFYLGSQGTAVVGVPREGP